MTKPLSIDTIVDKFLAAPLPECVCSDLCVTKPGPGRYGTALLTGQEAKWVLEPILEELVLALWHCWTMTQPGNHMTPEDIRQSVYDRCVSVLNPLPRD